MVSSLPELPPPLSFLCIIGILIVYVMCCYLIIDFISEYQDDSPNEEHHSADYSSYFHISVEELQEITCLYHNHNAKGASICAICLENLRHAQVCRVLPACHHHFHAHCIDPWLSIRLTCPTCRAPFRSSRA